MENLFTQEAPGCDFSKLQAMVADGDIRAYEVLACCYLVKLDPSDDDINKAIELLKTGAKKGDDNAMLILWSFYINQGDKKNADKWSKKVHNLHLKNHKKHPSLQTEYDLAIDLQYGFGVKQDVTTARRRLECLAKQKFNMAFYSLGIMYEEGCLGCRKNRSAALRRYQKGAELDDPNCMEALARIYEQSHDKDPKIVFELYERLSKYKYGWGKAQTRMGEEYLYGNNVNEDLNIAKEYLTAAASLGDIDATIFLNAIQAAERDCIKTYGSLEATPKNTFHAKIAGAAYAISTTGKLIPLD